MLVWLVTLAQTGTIDLTALTPEVATRLARAMRR